MKKQIANIVTLSRVVGAIVLFFCKDFSSLFISIYIFCGFTDLIDGPIARKTGSSSALGASLDTIGDVLTYLALTKILVVQRAAPYWILGWILSDGVLFGICAIISKLRFGKFYLPVAMQFMPGKVWMSVICIIASVHAAELFYIQLKSKTAHSFVATVFSVNK